MPNRGFIEKEISNASDTVRRKYLKQLKNYTGRDTILCASAFASSKLPNIPNFLITITNEDIQFFMTALHGLKGNELDLVLHSPGGSLEAAEQIIEYLRQKYQHIRVIVPQNAMSAATIMACGADCILMGKQSALGPIDPQITLPTERGHFTSPARSILDEFDEAKESVTNEPKTAAIWIQKISKYPPGFLKMCGHAIELSKIVVIKWLKSYMFKNEPDAEAKAESIANWLSFIENHRSHGRPLMAQECKSHGLKIVFIEDDPKLQDHVLSVFHSTMLTFQTTNTVKLVENHIGKGLYLKAQVQMGPMPMPSMPPIPMPPRPGNPMKLIPILPMQGQPIPGQPIPGQ